MSTSAARDLLARALQLRNAGRSEAVLRSEFESRLRSVFPGDADEVWVNHYAEGAEAHTRVGKADNVLVSRFIDTLVHSTLIEFEADLRDRAKRTRGRE